MLHSIKKLLGKKIDALDAWVGRIEDCYFDDNNWAVRYLVAETSWWKPPRRVLLSPHALGPIPPHGHGVPVNLTKAEIRNSPPLETHEPITRRYEMDYYNYYNWPLYWQGGSLWGPSDFPTGNPARGPECQKANVTAQDDHTHGESDAHLESARAVIRLPVYCGEDCIGCVTDLLLDEKKWRVPYVVIDVGGWFIAREMLLSTRKVQSISWDQRKVKITPTKEAIERLVSRQRELVAA